MASKPLSVGNTPKIVLGMSSHQSTYMGVGYAAAFTSLPVDIAKGLQNSWFVQDADKIGAWRMAHLCIIDGDYAVPVSQFGADLVTGREWGLKDAARIYTKGTHEPPQVSTRRMEYLFETGGRKLVHGTTYLVRSSPSEYERPRNPVTSSSVDANLCKGVLVAFEQNLAPRAQSVVVGKEAYLANGWLSVYDGEGVREASPNFIPPAPNLVSSGSSTSSLQVSWMVVDKSNRVLRTSVSAATSSFDEEEGIVFGQPPSYARARGRTRFEMWASTDTATIPVRLVGVGDPSKFTSGGPFVYAQVLFNGAGPLLATTSELQPEPLGGCVYVAATSNRIWYIEPEDTARVRFSKDFSVLGRVEFNRNLYIDIPDGSRPVAVATLDEQVVIFTERSIYLVTGNLPNNAGGGANFYLQRVAFEDGCSNRYSILESRMGIFFESDRGINLLTRGYEVVFAGDPVEDSASGGFSVTGTAHLPQEDLYLFTTDTKVLVAHESGGSVRWTEWVFEQDGNIVASCAWGNYHVVLTDEGELFYMDMSVVTDVILTVTTPWMYFGDLEGFQRVRDVNLLGRNETTTTYGSAVLQIGYDFATSFAETFVYEYGTAGSNPMRIRLKPARAKCASFRLRYAEVSEVVGQSTILDAAVTLAGISVEVGVKPLGAKRARTTPSA